MCVGVCVGVCDWEVTRLIFFIFETGYLDYFGDLDGILDVSRGILVILEISGIFQSFWRYFSNIGGFIGIFNYFTSFEGYLIQF